RRNSTAAGSDRSGGQDAAPSCAPGVADAARPALPQGEPMMTCREMLDFLGQYVDGALPADERAVFEQHLAVCPECVAYLHNYSTTVRLGRLASREMEERQNPLPDRLVQAILTARSKSTG